MKTKLSALALAVAMLASFGVYAEVNVTELDARPDDSDSGMYLMFISKPIQPDAPMGDGFFAIGKGEDVATVEVEAAYGMHLDKGRPNVAPVSNEHIGNLMASDSGAPVTVTSIRVSGDQYEQLQNVIAEWSKIEKHDVLPINAALDATQEAISTVGFKRPYRTGLGMPNLMLYFSDISLVNRKRTAPGA